jgi:hypothetical protein
MAIQFLSAPTTADDNQQVIVGTNTEVWTTNKETYLQILAECCNITVNYKIKRDIPISELLGREVGVYNPAILGLHIEYIKTDLIYDDENHGVIQRHSYKIADTIISFDFEITFEELQKYYYGMIPWSVCHKTGEVYEYARFIDSN